MHKYACKVKVYQKGWDKKTKKWFGKDSYKFIVAENPEYKETGRISSVQPSLKFHILWVFLYIRNVVIKQMFRPWDSIEDLERPVVLSSSGCASGCASDHCPPANSAPFSLTPTLPRHCKPGYTHLKSNTMPHIRSVSGTILWPLVSLQNEKSQKKTFHKL